MEIGPELGMHDRSAESQARYDFLSEWLRGQLSAKAQM